MAGTAVITDALFLQHDPGPGHPESPRRLSRTLELLESTPIAGVTRVAPRDATEEQIARVHGAELRRLLKSIDGKTAMIDGDTITSPASYRAAVLAAGAAV